MESFKTFFAMLSEHISLPTGAETSIEVDENFVPINKDEMTVDLTRSEISAEYFEKVEMAATMLTSFYETNIATTAMHNALYNQTLLYKRRTYDDLKLCLMIDVIRCYYGLNHSTSLFSKEGLGLLLLLVKMYRPDYMMSFQTLSEVPESIVNLDALVPFVCQCSDEINFPIDTIIISQLLQEAKPKADILYRTVLYRFCEAISEADGVISISEKEWLMNILRLDDDDLSNDINIDSIFNGC